VSDILLSTDPSLQPDITCKSVINKPTNEGSINQLHHATSRAVLTQKASVEDRKSVNKKLRREIYGTRS